MRKLIAFLLFGFAIKANANFMTSADLMTPCYEVINSVENSAPYISYRSQNCVSYIMAVVDTLENNICTTNTALCEMMRTTMVDSSPYQIAKIFVNEMNENPKELNANAAGMIEYLINKNFLDMQYRY